MPSSACLACGRATPPAELELDPTGFALTAVLFGAIGAREAWLRHRYPSAA